jgi:hypothetical protein
MSQNLRDRKVSRRLSASGILDTLHAVLGGVGGLAGTKKDGMLATVDYGIEVSAS